MSSNSFSSETAIAPATLPGKSYGAETIDLRNDVEDGFVAIEARTSFPVIDSLDLGAAGGITAAGSVDVVVKGRALLNGSVFASVAIVGLTLDAVIPGIGANSYTAAIVDTGSGGLTIAMAGDDLVIDQGGSGSDEDTIATLINDAGEDTFGKIRANSAGGAAMAIATAVPLIGGLGTDFSCDCNGIAVPLLHPVGAATAAASMSDTTITLNPPALTSGGAAAGDACKLHALCNGVMESISSVLV